MRCTSSRTPGIGIRLAVLSLGLAGCPVDSDDPRGAAGPASPAPVSTTRQALQVTVPTGQTAVAPTGTDSISKTAQAVQSAFSSGRARVSPRGVSRLYGPSLSTGGTPAASAQAFQRAYASAMGIDPSDLMQQELKQGKALASSAPKGRGLMWNQTTGQPKFWLYQAGQTKNGIRVHRADLLTLVRNDGDNPVVWSSSSLRDLSGFVPPADMQARAPDRDKSLASIPATTDRNGLTLPPPQSITSLSTPQLVIFAGNKGELAPRTAIEYTAATAPSGKWHFIADASTGDVLSVESLSSLATISGTVTGNVTGNVAMECSAIGPAPLAYAEVDSEGAGAAWTNVSGAYALPGNVQATMNVNSPLAGWYFTVVSADPSVPAEDLWTSVTPPVTTANFLHNAAGSNPELTAQTNAYVQANLIRDFVLKYIPDYPGVVDQVSFGISVNTLNDQWPDCPGNARYNYDEYNPTMDLCVGGPHNGLTYSNFAFAGILYHEYGHHVVANGTNVKNGQGPYGEGMGDTMEILAAGSHSHAPGAFLNQCTRSEREAFNRCQYLGVDQCSDCGTEAHDCGQLVSGTIWDIRENLRASNPTTYVDLTNHLVLSSIQMNKADDPMNPDLAIDFLTLDDNDGNINNGTPHSSEICSAFALHGMTCPFALTVTPPTAFSAEGPLGGSFVPANMIYTVANDGPRASTIQYQVTASPAAAWLNITNGSGQLVCADNGNAPCVGGTSDVTVAINQVAAAKLAKGEYDTVLKFTNLTDHVGDTTRAVHLSVGLQPVYTETFEGGLGTFTLGSESTNLWHVNVSADCAWTDGGHSSPQSLYFGIDSSCDYANGQTVTGTATSGPITITDPSLVKLRFNYVMNTEHMTYWDQASVQISANGGNFVVVGSNNRIQDRANLTAGGTLDGEQEWQHADIDLAPFLVGLSSPLTVRVRFAFDSGDAIFNGYTPSNSHLGFMVDDIQILGFPNQAPVVEAGPNQTIVRPAAATLAGTVSDDGLPNPPAKVTTTWSKVSGPGTVTFANPSAASTTATFSIEGTYVLQLTGNDGALSTSDTVTVTVSAPGVAPTIITQPQTRNIPEGQPVTFTVVATGTAPLHYQWKKSGVAVGTDAASFTIAAVKQSDAGGYTVTVSNTAGSVNSATAQLIVMSVPPSITIQPQSQTVTVGQSVTFTVTATGTAPLHYQWRKNGTSVGTDSASFTIASVQMSDGTTYTVMVTNAAGSVTSSNATLTVKAVAPAITTQPLSQTKKAGQSVTFTVTATGTAPLTYQWKKGSNVVGGNSASFTISKVQKSDAGNYTVTVSNSGGSTTSKNASLTVN